MASPTPTHPEVALNLALAVVASSTAPVLLLDGDLKVIGASNSFCSAFQIDPATVRGRKRYGRNRNARHWFGPRPDVRAKVLPRAIASMVGYPTTEKRGGGRTALAADRPIHGGTSAGLGRDRKPSQLAARSRERATARMPRPR